MLFLINRLPLVINLVSYGLWSLINKKFPHVIDLVCPLVADPAARDMETPVLVLAQGREPPHFTGYFPHWKHNMWKVTLTAIHV